MNEKKIALALLHHRTSVEGAIADLGAAGIAATEISVLQRDDGVLEHVAQHAAGMAANDGKTSALGSLTSLGSIVCVGVHNLIAAGPIRLVLDASVRGTVTVTLRALGATEQRAAMYEGQILEGAILVAVHTCEGKHVGEARRVLSAHGAEEISVAVPSAATLPN